METQNFTEPMERLLLGPGPSNVNPRVIRAMTLPLMGYLDPTFLKVMDEVSELLRQGVPHLQRVHPGHLRNGHVRNGSVAGQHAGAGRRGSHRTSRPLRKPSGGHRLPLWSQGSNRWRGMGSNTGPVRGGAGVERRRAGQALGRCTRRDLNGRRPAAASPG